MKGEGDTGRELCRTFGCVFSANAGCARAAKPVPQYCLRKRTTASLNVLNERAVPSVRSACSYKTASESFPFDTQSYLQHCSKSDGRLNSVPPV
jgi:hypothetical protein